MMVRGFNWDESQTDLLDRICDKGIVIAPWAMVSMMDPDRVRVDGCQATSVGTFHEAEPVPLPGNGPREPGKEPL